MKYVEFLKKKHIKMEPSGFDVHIDEINDKLFPFQKAVVKWALKRGKSAIFAGTGLGKTYMQLEWAWQVFQRSGNRVLILAPLCVARQTVKEADDLGYTIRYERSFRKDSKGNPTDNGNTGIIITNYEMLHEFEDAIYSGYFDGIVLDESSILKHQNSKTRNYIIKLAKNIRYKLSATATPSPNDYMELGNQAEFLGIMSMNEMLATFFIHDSGETSKWRLKGHGARIFWKWLSSWSAVFNKPSDIGFSDDGYVLPGLEIEEIVVKSEHKIEDVSSLSGRNEARRITIDERVAAAIEITNKSNLQWIVWCNLNEESRKLSEGMDDAVEVRGSDKSSTKEDLLAKFTTGEVRNLVTKPSIAGFGLNWQHCSNMVFVGLNDSYEQLYQAIRRCYRFGQKDIVKVYLITSELEGAVRDNIIEKEKKSIEMQNSMMEHMRDFIKNDVMALESEKTEYDPKLNMDLPSFIGAIV